ncbi:vascular cell adhesion protein 1-like [Penaeus chinensis]|uniref:vascular cell adhesion protein 1-like n=1 Tax=Penaeus chinensis TaxID=139456 RepID=UPI001FB6D701|nr:vascular cell adhesion protein 1-like [Penaeus chinensis]
MTKAEKETNIATNTPKEEKASYEKYRTNSILEGKQGEIASVTGAGLDLHHVQQGKHLGCRFYGHAPENILTEEQVNADRGTKVTLKCSAEGNPTPKLTWSRKPPTPNRGTKVTLKCSAEGNPTPKLTWSRKPPTPNSTEQIISKGVGVAKLSIGSASRADTGVYLCRASNLVGVSEPSATRVVVTHLPLFAADLSATAESLFGPKLSTRNVCAEPTELLIRCDV